MVDAKEIWRAVASRQPSLVAEPSRWDRRDQRLTVGELWSTCGRAVGELWTRRPIRAADSDVSSTLGSSSGAAWPNIADWRASETIGCCERFPRRQTLMISGRFLQCSRSQSRSRSRSALDDAADGGQEKKSILETLKLSVAAIIRRWI